MIDKQIPNKNSAAFLCGLATGIFDDPLMIQEFSRFGLQHLMAISGFHFALVALIISALFKYILPEKKAARAIVLLLTGYFVFLGASPSVFRAFVMASIYFFSILASKQCRPLNSLGFAAIIVLLTDPLSCMQLGFRFSFLVTGSILVFFRPMDRMLQNLLPKRRFSELVAMDRLSQHGYVVSSLLRQSLALMLSVQISALPLILYTTHKFPILSLLYNLFFPFLVSVSLFLLILGLIMPLPLIHSFNSSYTSYVLNLAYGLPSHFDFWIRIENFSTAFFVLLMTAIFFLAIYLRQRMDEARMAYL